MMIPFIKPIFTILAFAGAFFAAEPAGAETPVNLLSNPGFDDGRAHWEIQPSPNGLAEVITVEDRTVAHLGVPPGDPVAWPNMRQYLDVTPGDVLECMVEARSRGVRDGYGVYAAFDYFDANGQRISFEQSRGMSGDSGWETLHFRGVVPAASVRMSVALLLNGHGDAWFDNVMLHKLGSAGADPPEGPVVLTVSDTVTVESLVGFGFEDDGWFYNAENAAHGLSEADAALREGRIEWMDPDWVRMFFWYKDWNPSQDWETFTFDSDNMESHYRTLDLYQRIGAKVNVTNVEWGMTAPYADLASAADAIGALMEHLIVSRGYTCIQYWTLTNEPNLGFLTQGSDFAGFVKMYQLVRQAFDARGLDIRIVGSDDAQNVDWFRDCVLNPDYHATVDLYSSHRYFRNGSQPLIPYFFGDRLSLLAEQEVARPFVVGEFGFQDERSGTLVNPLMEEYAYAVWTTDFCIQGLNRGVAGMSIWCLHEVYYPGNGFMNYGLWNYRNRDWAVRPVYHAIANLCRNTEAGDRAVRCESSHPTYAKGAVVGDTLFWVNPGTRAVDVRLVHFPVDEVHVYTEDTISGDRETGYTVPADGTGTFPAPPMSFGYAKRANHSADTDRNGRIDTAELLRVLQFHNAGALHCQPGTVDGYGAGPGDRSCAADDSDYLAPGPDWRINLSEVLRAIQLSRAEGYTPCAEGEDRFCPNPP